MDHLVVGIVFLLACVCVDVCVKYNTWTKACVAKLWVCVSVRECVCTHRMPTVRREDDGMPAFCHLNPPFPVTHWSLRSHRALWQRPKGPYKDTGLSSNVRPHMMDRPPVVSEMFELNYLLLTQIVFKLDCHLCLWKSIIAQSVSLYCTVPWYIPLQLKHRRTFQSFFVFFKTFKLMFFAINFVWVSARSNFILPWHYVIHISPAIMSEYHEPQPTVTLAY